MTYSFHLASARTIDRFSKAARKRDPSLIEESQFFIVHQPGVGLSSTVIVNKPAAYDLPIPPIPKTTTVRDKNEISIVHFHTHPPLGDILAPSVLIETDKGYIGDLYAFSSLRVKSKENALGGRKPSFIDRHLAIILQDDLATHRVNVIFLRESKQLALLDHPTYIQKLRENAELFAKVPDIQTVCQHLRQLGFLVSWVDLSFTDYYDYPPFSFTQAQRIAEDLQD